MKIVFAGSPEFAVPVLKALVQANKNIVAVITQPDKPVGRKRVLTPTPVKACANSYNIPVYDFAKIKDSVSVVQSLGADIMITCAYGQILSQAVLDCFKGGVWNIHASLLPKFRGASPVQSAILAGETHTGVTVMKTELSLDTGDMLLVKRCEIGSLTAGELFDKLSLLGAEAAVEAVELLEKGDLNLLLQDDSAATYCKKIEKSDAKINFSSTAKEICSLIRAMNPAPLAYCQLGESTLNLLFAEEGEDVEGRLGEVVFADKRGIGVKCQNGSIIITKLKPAGGKEMLARDFVNGRKIKVGDILE
ncbi:MAG: methionyl-tRNA formyltransferase [Clostridiales bacterium]|nr:methionyl-tRNA formyltransferase [Clostridiales bacterium]